MAWPWWAMAWPWASASPAWWAATPGRPACSSASSSRTPACATAGRCSTWATGAPPARNGSRPGPRDRWRWDRASARRSGATRAPARSSSRPRWWSCTSAPWTASGRPPPARRPRRWRTTPSSSRRACDAWARRSWSARPWWAPARRRPRRPRRRRSPTRSPRPSRRASGLTSCRTRVSCSWPIRTACSASAPSSTSPRTACTSTRAATRSSRTRSGPPWPTSACAASGRSTARSSRRRLRARLRPRPLPSTSPPPASRATDARRLALPTRLSARLPRFTPACVRPCHVCSSACPACLALPALRHPLASLRLRHHPPPYAPTHLHAFYTYGVRAHTAHVFVRACI
mmetsp:Transcript_5294/g.15127  ORF Transcript_5294/g.15127 Transcript_5294/m.15127 type:complete len:345 (-) Transcript_5294:46-1080(-)